MDRPIENLVEIAILIKKEIYEYHIMVENDGIRFERYSPSTNRRETLQEVVNTIRANNKKRERVWRADPPSYESGYSMFYIKL